MKTQTVKRFEIYLYDFGAMPGSIQNGIRPALIIQDNRFNENSPTTIVAAITSVIKKERLPSHIFLGQEFGLSKPSMVMLEQLRTVNQDELREYVGAISDPYLTKIIGRGIKKTLGMWEYAPRDKTAIRCLCPQCAESYRNTRSFIIRRLDPFQKAKDACDRCNRPGWDYVVVDRKR